MRVSSTMFDAYTSLYSVRNKQASNDDSIYTIVDTRISRYPPLLFPATGQSSCRPSLRRITSSVQRLGQLDQQPKRVIAVNPFAL